MSKKRTSILVILFAKTADDIHTYVENTFEAKMSAYFRFLAVIDEDKTVQVDHFEVQTILNPEPRHPITFFMGCLRAIGQCRLESTYITSFSTKLKFRKGALEEIISTISSRDSDHDFFYIETELKRKSENYYWFNVAPYHWPFVPYHFWSQLGCFCFYFDTSISQALFFQKHMGKNHSVYPIGNDLLLPYPFSAGQQESPKTKYCDMHYQTNGKGLLTFKNFYHLLAVQKVIYAITVFTGSSILLRQHFDLVHGKCYALTESGRKRIKVKPGIRDIRLYLDGLKPSEPLNLSERLGRFLAITFDFLTAFFSSFEKNLKLRQCGKHYFLFSKNTLHSILDDLEEVGGINQEEKQHVLEYVEKGRAVEG